MTFIMEFSPLPHVLSFVFLISVISTDASRPVPGTEGLLQDQPRGFSASHRREIKHEPGGNESRVYWNLERERERASGRLGKEKSMSLVFVRVWGFY